MSYSVCTLYNYEYNGEPPILSVIVESIQMCHYICILPKKRNVQSIQKRTPINVKHFMECNIFNYDVSNGNCSLFRYVSGYRFNPNFISGSGSEC